MEFQNEIQTNIKRMMIRLSEWKIASNLYKRDFGRTNNGDNNAMKIWHILLLFPKISRYTVHGKINDV